MPLQYQVQLLIKKVFTKNLNKISLKMKVPIKLTIPLKVKIKMCQVHLVQRAGARQRYNPPRPRYVLCIIFPITGTSASRLSYLESHHLVPKVLQN